LLFAIEENAVRAVTRRTFIASAAGLAAWGLADQQKTLRTQVGGEWCFLKLPEIRANGQVVLTLHGAGEWVDEKSSSWETQPGATQLMDTLLAAGFAVAQSNAAARHGNGMWGNRDTRDTTVAMAQWLAKEHGLRTLHAVAVSAGNLVLTNLLLTNRLRFASAVMLAPCLSLASEYKCPGGVNRVKTIAEAYGFPAAKCPGDPSDAVFLKATAEDDPALIVEHLDAAGIRAAFGHTRWMAVYETHDPRVPPQENLLPFVANLHRGGVNVRVTPMEADTHGSQELFLRHTPAILSFLQEQKRAL
jgi:hypothetical protein